jgi:hypothetical protein
LDQTGFADHSGWLYGAAEIQIKQILQKYLNDSSSDYIQHKEDGNRNIDSRDKLS